MKVRDITNGDLEVHKPDWVDSRGRERVHVSLKGASWCYRTYWLSQDEMAKPTTLEKIKADLKSNLCAKLERLKAYLQ